MHDSISEHLNNLFYSHEKIKLIRPELERQLHEGKITSYLAALKLLDYYFEK